MYIRFGGVEIFCIFAPPKKQDDYETDISAIEDKAQEQARFQGENGYRQWAQGIGSQKGKRAEKADCVRRDEIQINRHNASGERGCLISGSLFCYAEGSNSDAFPIFAVPEELNACTIHEKSTHHYLLLASCRRCRRTEVAETLEVPAGFGMDACDLHP